MRRADQITGIFMLTFSCIVAYASWQMPQRVEFGPGMGFLPFWLGVLMAALSAALFIDASMRKGPAGGSPFPKMRALLNVMLVVAGLAIYILALSRLGFSASTFLFVAFLLGVVEKERWFKACFIALLSTAGLYLIFRILLDVKLPKNMYGF